MTPLVRVRGLTRDFGAIRAVDRVDFDVERADAVAIVGPPRAGRSTLLQVLGTLLRPSAGELAIGGVDVVRNPAAARAQALYVAADGPRGGGLSVREYLGWVEQSPRARRATRRRSLNDVLRRANLPGDADVDRLRPAPRCRLALAALLLMCPAVALLDEPLLVVDSETRAYVRQCVAELRDAGAALITAVGATDDADDVADVVIAMDRGRLSPPMWPTGINETHAISAALLAGAV